MTKENVKKETKMYAPIAIVGYSCMYPGGATNNEKFWDMIINGKTSIDVIPEDRWKWQYYFSEDKAEEDKTYSKLGACCSKNIEIDSVYKDKFDLEDLNRIQIMALNTILHCLEKNNYDLKILNEKSVGYFMGNMLGDDLYTDYSLRLHLNEIIAYIQECDDFKKIDSELKNKIIQQLTESVDTQFKELDERHIGKYMNSALAYLVKRVLDIKGPSVLIDGACSSGLLVIDEAIKRLHSNELEMCIVTGVLGSVNVIGSVGFSKIGGLSSERSRPLDRKASGLNSSEGVGTIIIKKLDRAIQDGDTILGVISGTGVSNDGKGKSIYAPNKYGQVKAMYRAVENANVLLEDIDYIEVHATGTPTGDIEELETLKLLYKDVNIKKQSIPIGSVKSQIGHSFSAAGMANLIKCLESMRHKCIPPTWGYENAPTEINLENTPFYINTKMRNWRKNGRPRRAIINAFGFGGINASLVLEEYDQQYHNKKNIASKKLESVIKNKTDIAIVGVGVIDSKAHSSDEWFEKIDECYSVSKEYPSNRWSKLYRQIFSYVVKEACFIENYKFPFLKYKIPPKVLYQIDRSQPLALMAAGEAIEDFGLENIELKKVSVYVAKMMGAESASVFNTSVRYVEFIERLKQIKEFNEQKEEIQNNIIAHVKKCIREYAPPMTEDALPGYMDNIVSGRISNFYDFDGSSLVIDAGTQSFSEALKQGVYDLMNDESDIVLVGGIHTNMSPEFLEVFNKYVDTMDIEYDCVPAEGVVFFVLKRQDHVTSQEKVYGRIRGVVDNNLYNSVTTNECIELKDTLVSNTGRKLNYFGAQVGFEMLYAIDYFNKMKENSNVIIKINEKGIMGNPNTVYIANPGYIDEIRGSIEDDVHTLYLQADTMQGLELEIDRILNKGCLPKQRIAKVKRYQFAVVYQTYKELEKKLTIYKKLCGVNNE